MVSRHKLGLIMWSLTFHKRVSCPRSVTPFRTDLCKGSSNDPTKPSLALFTVHLHQLTINLFNPVPLNLLGLAKGSQMTTRKTTRWVSLLSNQHVISLWISLNKSVSGCEAEVKYVMWKVWPCGNKCQRPKRERHHISQWSPLLVEQLPPPLPPQVRSNPCVTQPSRRDWPIKTCFGPNQGLCRLVVDSELSPDASVF